MAWNGSNEKAGNAAAPARGTRHEARGTKHGLIAFALIALGGGLAAWLFMRPSEEPARGTRDESRGTLIAEVKPQIATNAAEYVATSEKPKGPRPQRVGEARDGKVLMPNGELRPIKGEVMNATARTKASYAIFSHSSENIIAGLLSAKPGTGMVGTPRYNGVFTKNFLKSCEEPIIVRETDDEDTKALKRAVNEAKIELKAAYDRGEDIEQIILDSRAELQRLGRIRDEMRRNVLRAAAEGAQTPGDVDTLVAAANKMLEEKGIAPLDDTPLMNVKLRLMREQELRNGEKENAK